MKDENKNIDDFFLSRLQNEMVGDDWNMPSDDIWNAAKSQFVNRKKSKRRFIFWIWIPILVLSTGISYKILDGGNTNDSMHLSNESPMPSDHYGVNLNEESYVQTAFKSTDGILREKVGGVMDNILEAKEIEESAVSNISKEDNLKLNKEIQLSGKIQLKNRTEDLPISDAVHVPKIAKSKLSGMINTETPKLRSSQSPRSKIIISNLDNKTNEQNQISSIKSNSSLGLVTYPHTIVVKKPKIIIPLGHPTYRNEIGLSHSELLLNLALAIGPKSENGIDEIELGSKYFNANITGRKWINKKWSFMTGAQYYSLDLDIKFSVFDTLDKELMQFINEEFNDITSRNSIGDSETGVIIDLKDGVDTQLGDILNIRGDVTQKVRAIQIPFFLDYHIYKRKMEYILGFGATLEYVKVSETPNDFQIFKLDELISKPADFPNLEESFIDASIYLKSGVRYSLSDKINIGLDAKVNLLSLLFSGIDAGIYYRWN